MRIRSWWTLILVVVASLCLAGWPTGANTSSKVSWEYKYVSTYGPSASPNMQQFNEAGAEGWELVAVRPVDPPHTGAQVRTDYFFKRVK